MPPNLVRVLLGGLLIFVIGACKQGDIQERAVKTASIVPTLGIEPFSVKEGSRDTFLFTLSKAVDADVAFTWTIGTGDAAPGPRFTALTGSGVVPRGATAVAVPIPLIDDGIYQGTQTFALSVALVDAPAGVALAADVVPFAVVDDEATPQFRFRTPAQAVAEASGTATVVVTLSGPANVANTVGLSVGGTASNGADYAFAPAGPLTFAAGETAKTLTVTLVDDDRPEADETIDFALTTVSAGTAVVDSGARVHRVTIVNDDFAPVVTELVTSIADGSYHAGTIPVTVRFSRAVRVTGAPTLTLETGSVDRAATYAGGDGTNELTFAYVVQAGDRTEDLDAASVNSLALNGGTIRAATDGLDALLTLPSSGAAGALGTNHAIRIDTDRPRVTNVSSPDADGAYTVGATLTILVTATEPVFVTGGTPSLRLETGAIDRAATYTGGSGTTTLSFAYLVRTGDTAADLDVTSASALTLNGAAVRDLAGNDVDPTVPGPGAAGSLGATKDLVIDSTAPRVTTVSSPLANGSYRVGQTVPITVTFSEAVFVDQTPRLTLETGAVDRTVDYVGGSGSSTLQFTYVVRNGDTASRLDTTSTTALVLNGGRIVDAAANDAIITLPAPGAAGSLSVTKAIEIDTTDPAITSLTAVTPDGAYRAGQVITLHVVFGEPVLVTGTPRLTLETGPTDRVADFVSGSGSSTLTFTYTVEPGDVASDLDAASPSALDLTGATITDPAGNAARTTVPVGAAPGSLASQKNIVVDTEAPRVTSVTSSTANGAYRAGQSIDVTVNFSEPVAVTGLPRIKLRTRPSSTADATFSGGSGSAALHFTYVVTAGDVASDLDYVSASALEANGGAIADPAGNDAVPTLPVPGGAGSLGANADLVLDTSAPTVTDVTSTANDGGYRAGASLPITVSFGEPVFVTGTPTLTLETGATDRVIAYASGSGTATLTFAYVVQAGENSADLDTRDVGSLSASGGTVRDVAGNDAALALPAPGAAGSLGANKNISVDTVAPVVTSLTATTPNGYYRAGAVIDVVVHFSESVTVDQTPRLLLETGATDRFANYVDGSGTTALTFRYVVQAGDTSADLDVASANALGTNGGSIRDAVGNDAVPTTPAPGATGSLGSNQDIVVDTTAPTAPGPVDDGTWTTSLGQSPAVTWTAATDQTSGVDHYEFALGITAGATDVLGWTANGLALTRTQYGLALTEGTTYFASVRAVDRAGNVSAATSGDGFRPDVTAPTQPATMTDGLTSASLTDTPALAWDASTDLLSGVARYQVAIGTSPGASDTFGWADVGLSTATTLTGLTLNEGSLYFASVRAVDRAGNVGGARAADGWLIGWLQEAYLKGSTNAAQGNGGAAVAISGDTMVVGAPGGSGTVYVYVRSGATWSQQAALTATNSFTSNGDGFGKAVAIDGNTIVVGAPGEDSASTTIGGAPTLLDLATDSGGVYVYTRTGTTWSAQTFAKASNSEAGDLYGSSVAISGDVVVVGAPAEASNATGASTSASTNNSSANAGAAYVLTRTGTAWAQTAYLKQTDVRAGVKFGGSVAVGGDTIVVGAAADPSFGTTVTNGTGGSGGTGATNSGAAYVFRLAGATWTAEAQFKASNSAAGAQFGSSVAVSSAGVAVVGAPGEATGGANAGAAYVYRRSGNNWAEEARLKSTNVDAGDLFGTSVAIDQSLVLVGAPAEASAQASVGQTTSASADNSRTGAGAAYLFRASGTTWTQLAYLKAPNVDANDAFGTSVAIFGSTLGVGAPLEDGAPTTVTNGASASPTNTTTDSGAAYVFRR